MKRLLFFIGFMTVGTFALFQLLQVTTPTGPEPESGGGPQMANVLDLQGVTVVQREGQGVQWELHAALATYNEETQTGLLEQVRFQVAGSASEPAAAPQLQGQSGSAYLDARSNDVVLMGGVVLNRGEDLTIRSDRLEFHGRQGEIVAPGPVKVRTRQGVQEGDAMRYSLAEEQLEFTRPRFVQ